MFLPKMQIIVLYYWLANELVLLEQGSIILIICRLVMHLRKPISKVMALDDNCQQTAKN